MRSNVSMKREGKMGEENGVVALLPHFLNCKNGVIGLRPHFPPPFSLPASLTHSTACNTFPSGNTVKHLLIFGGFLVSAAFLYGQNAAPPAPSPRALLD